MDEDFYRQLIDRYYANQASKEEVALFFHLVREGKLEAALSAAADRKLNIEIPAEEKTQVSSPVYALRSSLLKYVAAATVILIGSALYFYFSEAQHEKKTEIAATLPYDIAPGSNKAVLTLSNGAKIILDSAHTGLLAKQNGADVIKSGSGKLAYTTGTEKPISISYNTLTTPRGGQYQLVLPDGTKVWLDAASSITYPTAFTGNERKVVVTGQAYFEVVHNAKMPFRVKAGDQTIEDIGTHFNINSYFDEPALNITLLEGAVRVQSVKLTPGEQAQITTGNKMKVIHDVDLDQVVAWKNGYFNFEDADIKTVLRQLARWYDVEVVYDGNPAPRQIYGKMQRELNLSQVLNILKKLGVNYRLEGRKIIVLN